MTSFVDTDDGAAGPLPKFDGITIPGQSSPLPPPPAGAGRVPSLAPEKMSEYSSLFEKAGAQDGLLAGKKRCPLSTRVKG